MGEKHLVMCGKTWGTCINETRNGKEYSHVCGVWIYPGQKHVHVCGNCPAWN